MTLSDTFITDVRRSVGVDYVHADPPMLSSYAADALGVGHSPDLVVRPGSTREVADLARAQLLEELVEDFDLDPEAAAVVVPLVDQIHGLRHALRRLGEAVAAEHPEVRERIRARIAGRTES